MNTSEKAPVYKRVLLKISGEALAGDSGNGYDFNIVTSVCEAIKECTELGVEVAVVAGGGNFWRGVKDGEGKIERTRADYMGMIATVLNCLALADRLEQMGVHSRIQTALSISAVAEPYNKLKADSHLKKGRVVIFGCGTGHPYFSTDTAAVLRAAEIGADIILSAKNIDGVYTADPKKDKDAKKIDVISYDEMLDRKLMAMDLTATSLAMENNIPVLLFGLNDPENIVRAVTGERVGTRVG